MWTRLSGKSDGSKDRDDEKRRSGSSSTRRSKGAESIVSSSSARRPSARESRSRAPESVASSYATFATAQDNRDDARSNADLYDDPRDDDRRRRYREDDERSTYTRKERSRSRDRGGKDQKKEKDSKDKDKDKREKRKSRSEAGGARPQELVESPRRGTRSVAGQMESGAVSPYVSSGAMSSHVQAQFPGQNPSQFTAPHMSSSGSPMMSGGLPAGTMSSHVQAQFPGQNPAQFTGPSMPPGPVHTDSFGEAAAYYGDFGESVQHQPGVRPDRPSTIVPLDTPHLISASAQPNPVADTGSGAAAEFYGTSSIDPPPSKPPRPSSMPGAFVDDGPSPQKPPRPSSSKPGKTGKISSAAAAAGVAYAIGHSSSHEQQTSYSSQHNTNYTNQHITSYTNGTHAAPTASADMYYHGDNASVAATNGSIPTYSEAMAGAPPQKPPRPGKPEKQPSGSSNTGLYAAGAAGLAAYGLAHHNSSSNTHAHTHHHHTNSMPGGFPQDPYGPSPSPFMAGGMAHMHDHKGPVNKFADWWKNYDDVRKMEEYTEYIGVCRGCFDPRSNPMDAPRKHHYGRKRSGEFRPSGIQGKQSRYGLNEKASRYSLSGDEKRERRKKNSGAAGWVAAGLGGVGLASVGKALLNQRDDFDDTYSIKSGRHGDARSRVSRRSRSRSRDRKHHSSGRSEIRHRSHSHDRMSRMSVGVTGDRREYRDGKVVRHRSHSRSRSRSRDRQSGLLGAAIGAGLAATAVGASRRKHRSRSRSHSSSRSDSPNRGAFVRRRDNSDHDRRHSTKTKKMTHKSSRSSAGSFVDVSRTSHSQQQSQGGFLGGFFAAPPPKPKRRKSQTHLKKKKKRGFFNFGNDSTSSSSGSELAFGTGFVKRKQRASRRSSDEKLNATLVGLGATAAAIAAAQAGRNKGKHRPEIVAVRERRDHRLSNEHRRHATSRYGSQDADGWEDLPDDETSDSGSMSSGLAFGDYDWKNKSTTSLNSNGSGTNKWGWRWGSKKQKKKPSNESLYNSGANPSFIGSAAVGAATGAAIGAGLNRHDSNASSHSTLQSVYPVASSDPNSFDARRTSGLPTPQPLMTSHMDINIQQPQPMHQVPGAIYSTQAPPQPGYTVPSGPPVFAQYPAQQPYPLQHHNTGLADHAQHPPPPRRANSSPIQTSSWKRDAAIAGVAAGVGAGALALARKGDQSPGTKSTRFDFTPEQARKEGLERRERERDSDSERKRRKDEKDRAEEERRRIELQRQRDEAAKFLEAERLAKLEFERRDAERKREREERRAREARDAEERERHEREAQAESQRRAASEAQALRDAERYNALELEVKKKRDERFEAERRETEEREARERRELEIRADMDRRRREREAEEYSSRYESDRERKALEQQRTGSSVASGVRRKERELEERERDIVQPDKRSSTAATAAVVGTAAAITSAAISSSKRDKRKDREAWSPEEKSAVVVSPPVKQIEPSQIQQDYADEEIFDKDYFKKKKKKSNVPSNVPQFGTAYGVLQDWEDRYHEPQVSQADFFAPKELLEDTSAPTPRKVDPNEGATDMHVYQAHDDLDHSAPKRPPYDPSYSFTATKDGRGPPASSYAVPDVPVLNLIQPTPPGSRANSVRAPSIPPSPVVEPVPEPKKTSSQQDEANRRGSRVSWGENQFHNYEVMTPDSHRDSFISDRDLRDNTRQAHDEIIVERDSPGSGKQTSSYRPQQEPEYPTSTQFVPDQEEDSWSGTMSKKASKKDKKKAKAAVAAAAAVTTAAVLGRDDKHDTSSTVSNSFADKYATSSVQSSVPSTSSVYQSPHYDSVEDVSAKPSISRGFVGEEITAEPEPIHIPGSFDDDAAPSTPIEDEWAAPSKKGKKAKKGKKSKGTEDDFFSQDSPKTVEPEVVHMPEPEAFKPETVRMPEPESFRPSTSEPEVPLSKKEKKKKKGKSTDDSYFELESPKTAEPTWEPTPELVREATPPQPAPEPEKPMEDDWAAPTKKGKKDKKGKKSKGAADDFYAQDTPKVPEPEPIFEPVAKNEPEPEPEFTLSKKDKKKKGKAAKRASIDSWEESESSQAGTPAAERDIRDVEPSYTAYSPPKQPDNSHGGGIDLGSSRADGSSSGVAQAAMLGGFAGLVSSAMKQDQDRMASDLEHARKNLQSANEYSTSNEPSSTLNGAHDWDDTERRISIPSTAFAGEFDELADTVKTPKKKKRHSSGKWSPSVGSPLRSEVRHEDYIGAPLDSVISKDELFMSPPKDTTEFPAFDPPSTTDRTVHDSGYYAPDDQPRADPADRDSDEFFSAGSDDRKKSKVKSPSSDKYDDRDTKSVHSSPGKYDNDYDREERHRRHKEDRSMSRERGYALDDNDGERKHRHRRHKIDDQDDDWDTKSTISSSRSEANGERRRKHKHRDSDRNGSPEDRVRSSATSDPGDGYERKSSKHRSRRDKDDDNMSIASSPARYDEERSSSRKDKEKRSSGLFGLFSKSKESLVDTSSKSSKSRHDEDEDEDRRRRRKKKERGSTYGGSDDDDMRSVVSTSSRRSEKRRSGRDEDGRKV
jgi:serine/arginine repetitive matrix protein 2